MKDNMREIKDSTEEELTQKVNDSRSTLFEMRVKAKTNQMEKTADIRKQKKHIARILTEINSRKKTKSAGN